MNATQRKVEQLKKLAIETNAFSTYNWILIHQRERCPLDHAMIEANKALILENEELKKQLKRMNQ